LYANKDQTYVTAPRTGVRSALYYVFLLFVFFPYFRLVPTETDMQPFAMLSAIGLFFLFRKKISTAEIGLFITFLTSVLIFLVDAKTLVAVRSFFNYASLFFIAYVSYRVLRSRKINFESFFLFSFLLWFSVSLVQTFYDNAFLSFMVSASRTTDDRGVTGFAPEPTFLGVVFIFFIVIALHLQHLKYRKLIISLSIISVLFFAKSTMVTVFLALMLLIFLLTHFGVRSIFLAFLSFIFVYYLFSFLEGSRVHRLMGLLIEEPSSLLLVDASINDRFFHVFFSLKGFFENLFIPNGFNSWVPYVSSQLPSYKDVVIVEGFSLGGRIMSGYGGAFFELGIFFILVPIMMTFLLFKIYRSNINKFIFFSVFMNLIMFSAIPIGFPLFAFYLGLLSFLNERKKIYED